MNKKISRQRRWQVKMKANGRCIQCGQKSINVTYCDRHRKLQLGYEKKWRLKKKKND